MRRVDRPEDLEAAFTSARRESAGSFGDDTMLLEKLLLTPRHVEVQVFCDAHGNAAYLFERDCSAQRRHQKIIEEAPAPGLDETLRQRMGEAAVIAAQAIDYRGAGTVEFLLDENSAQFYFMEMNTRLQVEHPVSEMITGEDLVEWQLRVAAGEPLPLQQSQLERRGHAFEARIYAEDPDNGFLPATGRLSHLSTPREDRHVRVDTGVRSGDAITPWYDPMIAKLVVWDEDRVSALRRLRHALREFRVAGLSTNVAFLYNLAVDDAFSRGAVHTRYVEDNQQALTRRHNAGEQRDRALAGLYLALLASQGEGEDKNRGDPWSPWSLGDAWRLSGSRPFYFQLLWHDEPLSLRIESAAGRPGTFKVHAENEPMEVEGKLRGNELHAVVNGHRFQLEVADDGSDVILFGSEGALRFGRAATDWQHEQEHGGFVAPINGRVVDILVSPGQAVAAGEPLMVLEAMKMEHSINAPAPGRVDAFHCNVGELVNTGQALLEFTADDSAG